MSSGMIELYTLGLATKEEVIRFESLLKAHPELADAAAEFEQHLELFTIENEDMPPEGVRERIARRITQSPPIRNRFLKRKKSHPYPTHVKGVPSFAEIPCFIRHPVIPDEQLHNKEVFDRVLADPGYMDQLKSRQFEQLVADMLTRLNFEVWLTPSTRDGGKDILAKYPTIIGPLFFVVECKHRSGKRKVGDEHIRPLYGIVEHEMATAGIIVTNSCFSPKAIEFQRPVENRLKLIGRTDLLNWIGIIRSKTIDPGADATFCPF